MKTKKMNNKGFSLVELIVVIAIMAILVGALAPALLKYVRQSRQSADIQAGNSLYSAVQAAIAEAGIKGTTASMTDTTFVALVNENLGEVTVDDLKNNTKKTLRTYTSCEASIGANDAITVTLSGSSQFQNSTITAAGSDVGAAGSGTP